MSWADVATPTLHQIRGNLLRGVDRLAEHLDAGTLDVIPLGRSSSPRQAGYITVILLDGVDAELNRRAS